MERNNTQENEEIKKIAKSVLCDVIVQRASKLCIDETALKKIQERQAEYIKVIGDDNYEKCIRITKIVIAQRKEVDKIKLLSSIDEQGFLNFYNINTSLLKSIINLREIIKEKVKNHNEASEKDINGLRTEIHLEELEIRSSLKDIIFKFIMSKLADKNSYQKFLLFAILNAKFFYQEQIIFKERFPEKASNTFKVYFEGVIEHLYIYHELWSGKENETYQTLGSEYVNKLLVELKLMLWKKYSAFVIRLSEIKKAVIEKFNQIYFKNEIENNAALEEIKILLKNMHALLQANKQNWFENKKELALDKVAYYANQQLILNYFVAEFFSQCKKKNDLNFIDDYNKILLWQQFSLQMALGFFKKLEQNKNYQYFVWQSPTVKERKNKAAKFICGRTSSVASIIKYISDKLSCINNSLNIESSNIQAQQPKKVDKKNRKNKRKKRKNNSLKNDDSSNLMFDENKNALEIKNSNTSEARSPNSSYESITGSLKESCNGEDNDNLIEAPHASILKTPIEPKKLLEEVQILKPLTTMGKDEIDEIRKNYFLNTKSIYKNKIFLTGKVKSLLQVEKNNSKHENVIYCYMLLGEIYAASGFYLAKTFDDVYAIINAFFDAKTYYDKASERMQDCTGRIVTPSMENTLSRMSNMLQTLFTTHCEKYQVTCAKYNLKVLYFRTLNNSYCQLGACIQTYRHLLFYQNIFHEEINNLYCQQVKIYRILIDVQKLLEKLMSDLSEEKSKIQCIGKVLSKFSANIFSDDSTNNQQLLCGEIDGNVSRLPS